jgi:hypothetical protein
VGPSGRFWGQAHGLAWDAAGCAWSGASTGMTDGGVGGSAGNELSSAQWDAVLGLKHPVPPAWTCVLHPLPQPQQRVRSSQAVPQVPTRGRRVLLLAAPLDPRGSRGCSTRAAAVGTPQSPGAAGVGGGSRKGASALSPTGGDQERPKALGEEVVRQWLGANYKDMPRDSN